MHYIHFQAGIELRQIATALPLQEQVLQPCFLLNLSIVLPLPEVIGLDLGGIV